MLHYKVRFLRCVRTLNSVRLYSRGSALETSSTACPKARRLVKPQKAESRHPCRGEHFWGKHNEVDGVYKQTLNSCMVKLKFLGFCTLLLLSGNTLSAQPVLGVCDQEMDEVAARQVPRAEEAWASGNMREAERYLKQGLRLYKDNADALYLLGHIEFRKGRMQYAQGLWKRLEEVCPDYKPMLYYLLGLLQQQRGERAKAIKYYEKFLAQNNREITLDKEVKAALKEARLREELTNNPVPYNPEPVREISTSSDEYLATISPDQKAMYFTRKIKRIDRKSGPAVKARMVEEFTKANATPRGNFDRGKPLPAPFNRNYNEGSPTITADNTEMYFTVCQNMENYKNCDIFYTEKDAVGFWTTPLSIGDHINRRNTWESQPSVSANGDMLIFASDREGGIGGIDLYICFRNNDGSWTRPEVLPKGINTTQDEKAPFLHPDNETLYYTSNGLPGMGSYDIFYARRTDSSWASPRNLGYPINSEEDDLGLFVSLDGKWGYFSSNSINSDNNWDLYRFPLPQNAQPRNVRLISGRLKGPENTEFANAKVKITKASQGSPGSGESSELRVDKETGRFAGTIKVNEKDPEDLIVTIEEKGIAFSSSYLPGKNTQKAEVVETELAYHPIEVGQEYTINDVNFESNSANLMEVSKKVIDRFARYLKNHPELSADIQGHTDNVGDDQANLRLSQQRAARVYKYLISKGVEPARLSHHGYGENKPIADNSTEKGRAANRRTVFVVVEQ